MKIQKLYEYSGNQDFLPYVSKSMEKWLKKNTPNFTFELREQHYLSSLL